MRDRLSGPSPRLTLTDETFAGLMPLSLEDNQRGSFFFWLAVRRTKVAAASRDSLVVWLNGGPGCSSMVGMMWEHGPFSLAEGAGGRFRLVRNPFAWNQAAHVLYVEQPLRTGFSTAAAESHRVRSEAEVARDFRSFLLTFLGVFPHLAGLPLFITGESYAGTYIPWIAEHIIRTQAQPSSLPRGEALINLQGVAIGNGEIDFVTQEASFAEYAYAHGLIPLSAKLHFERMYQLCLQGIEAGSKVSRGAFGRCSIMSRVLEAAGYPNEYNTNTFRSYDFISDASQVFHRFLNNPDIQTRIHVRGFNVPGMNFSPEGTSKASPKHESSSNMTWFEPKPWSVCNDKINSDMNEDHPTSAVPAIKFISEHIRYAILEIYRFNVSPFLPEFSFTAASSTSIATSSARNEF